MMQKWFLNKLVMRRSIIKILNKQYGHEKHLVCFGLKGAEGKDLVIFEDEACYRKLPLAAVHSCKEPIDTIWTKLALGHLAKKCLTDQYIIGYLREAYNAKLLPAYVSYNDIYDPAEDSLNLSLKYEVLKNPQELYTYFSIIRHIREDPGLVIAVNQLINYGFSFYAAFVIANTFVVEFSGHDLLGISSYYRAECTNDAKVKIHFAEALKAAAEEFDNNIKKEKVTFTFNTSHVEWNIHLYYKQKTNDHSVVTMAKLLDNPEKY